VEDLNDSSPVLIAGGGIGGMALALTLHQIGVPCQVLEAVPALKPLGVGINLQPNAVRELYDLGLGEQVLDTIGLQAREWALVGRNGHDVYSEPRGLKAGYRWPQYSVHRGQLQMLLYRTVLERLGPQAVQLGQRVVGYRQDEHGVTALVESRDGRRHEQRGRLLVAADGLHSAIRAQMHPSQPPIHHGGQLPGLDARRLEPARGAGRLCPPLRRLDLRLAGRARDAARRAGDLRVPHDRPRPGAHVGGRPRGADG
jgi:2-polyprenyl-6-methoxyphenol hydroxylase-like FAD-dependent oxidoreductase